jgi:hypothetical protein
MVRKHLPSPSQDYAILKFTVSLFDVFEETLGSQRGATHVSLFETAIFVVLRRPYVESRQQNRETAKEGNNTIAIAATNEDISNR